MKLSAHLFDIEENIVVKPYRRVDRVADLIMRELAVIIQQKSVDPRCFGATVTHVDVSPDLSNAKVYVTLLDVSKVKESLEALNQASGFFRKNLSQIIRIKRIPKLIFEYDKSVIYGSKLSTLIDKAIAADTKQHKDVE